MIENEGRYRTICRMSPRQRKNLDLAKLNERFGLHFQGLMKAAELTVAELQTRQSLPASAMHRDVLRRSVEIIRRWPARRRPGRERKTSTRDFFINPIPSVCEAAV
jgi:hypothetical protein